LTKAQDNSLLLKQTLIGAALTITLAMIQLRTASLASTKVESVRTDLESTGEKTTEKLAEIHTLVNSAMGAALRMTAERSRRIADMTGLALDIEDANVAEQALRDHEAKQRRADRAEATRPAKGD